MVNIGLIGLRQIGLIGHIGRIRPISPIFYWPEVPLSAGAEASDAAGADAVPESAGAEAVVSVVAGADAVVSVVAGAEAEVPVGFVVSVVAEVSTGAVVSETVVDVPATCPDESDGVVEEAEGAPADESFEIVSELAPLDPDSLIVCPDPAGWLTTTICWFKLDWEVEVDGWASAIQSKLVSAVIGWLVWMVKPVGVLVATP